MIEIFSEHVAVLLISWMAACLGALLVDKRPVGLLGWNRTFMAGFGAASTILFPLSLLFPHTALVATLLLLIGSAAYWLIGLRSMPSEAIGGAPRPAYDLSERVILGVIVLAVFTFAVINSCFPLGWDGLQIWATKGLVLYHEGALTPELWPPSPNTDITRVVKYPPMVALFTALLALVRGEFSWTGTKPLFFAFYLSMLVSIFDVGERLVSRKLALAAVLISALIPLHFDTTTAGGYADMPMAAALAAALGAIMGAERTAHKSIWRSPLVLMPAGMLMVKNEGLLLFLIAAGLVAIVLGRDVRLFWRPALGLCVVLLLRVGYLRWTIAVDITFGFNFVRAYHRAVQLPGAIMPWLLRWEEWGLFWPCVGAACIVLLVKGQTAERALTSGLVVGLLAYTGLYLFTNWDMALHISNSYSRILQHFIPVASLALVAAYGHLTRTNN